METVTPISSQESQQFQQEIISQASRAVQILLESLKQAGNKTTEQQQKEKLEQQKDNRDDNSKNQFKITIGGKDKAPEQLTWEDYGKLQACSQQDIGDNNLALADIKVLQISSDKKEIPLLETNPQGTVLTNVSKQSSPPNLTASQAVNQALNKLGKSPVKDYLLEVNQQLTQQLQQQQKLLQECQQFNLQLIQQLHQNQSVTEKSQSINQQQAQLIQNYQQLYQQRDKKDPQWWSKVRTQLNKTVNQVNAQVGQVGHKFGQAVPSLNQWWQQRNEQIKQQNNDQKSSRYLRYFAKEMMGTFDKNQKLSGDKYDLEKEGDFYKLTSKQGASHFCN